MKIAILLIPVLIFLQGCTLVTLEAPLGDHPVRINISNWEGIWYDDENVVLFITVKNQTNSILNVKAVEGSGEVLKIKEFTVILRSGTKIVYASIPFREIADKKELNNKNRDLYLWGAVKNYNGRIIFYSPDGNEFREFIEDGKLKGVIEKGYVYISSSEKTVMKLSESEKSGTLFDWKNPIILRKLK